LPLKDEYDPPGIGTISPMASRYAEDAGAKFVSQIATVLEEKGQLSANAVPFVRHEALRIHLKDYLNKIPVRRHNKHWIDGGMKVAVFHPITNLPFFMNNSGSKICKLCDGKNSVSKIIEDFKKEWRDQKPDEVLIKDLMKFLLLLEELDLIKWLE
jgi:hypothetical protein